MRKWLILFLFVLCVFMQPGRTQAQWNTSQVRIDLTTDGFSPQQVTIAPGTTVVFTTSRGRFFWPASNEHPSHTAYAQFDPKKPIEPEGSWSFLFEKEGVWGFHDHISPSFTGVIEVRSDGAAPIKEKKNLWTVWEYIKTLVNNFIVHNLIFLDYESCKNPSLERNERIACWEKIVIAIAQKKGLRPALDFVYRMKNRDTTFAADCHVYVHRIGEEYYWRFSNDRKIEVSDKFALCDQGFFHGFMQEFTSHGTSVREAKRYCDALMKRMKPGEEAHLLEQQCYHGIGHGATFLHAAYFWGNNDEIIAKAIADCHAIVPEDPHLCVSGVFGGIAAMYWGLHGFILSMDISDPWAICKNQKKPESIDCYDQLAPVLFGKVDQDMEKMGRMIEQIPDEEIARVTMEHMGTMPSYTVVPKTEDYTEIVRTCRLFRAPLDIDCFRGFAGAVVRIGNLAEATQRSIRFCESSELTPMEKNVCYESVASQIKNHYFNGEMQGFCEDVQERYGHNPCEEIEL